MWESIELKKNIEEKENHMRKHSNKNFHREAKRTRARKQWRWGCKGPLKPMSGWVTSSDELTFEMLTSLRVFNADMILHQNIHPWPHMVCDSPSAHRHPPLTSHGSWLLKCAQLIKLLFKITSGSEYKVKSANLYLLDVGCIMYMKILFKDTQNKALVVPCI